MTLCLEVSEQRAVRAHGGADGPSSLSAFRRRQKERDLVHNQTCDGHRSSSYCLRLDICMRFEKRAASHSHSITHKEKSFQVFYSVVAPKWLSTSTFSYRREHKRNTGVQRSQLAFTQNVIGRNGD